MFNFFGGSGTKPKYAKETFTHRREPKYPPPPERTPKPKSKPGPPPCPPFSYIPHHRNLGLQRGASNEEIKVAWRTLSLRLHPDKFRDPAQKEIAAAAMIHVNEAYDKLYMENAWEDLRLGIRRASELPDAAERRRRLADGKASTCEDIVRRKPWLWDYKEDFQCSQDGDYLCGEFWATLTHDLVDNVLPFRVSDSIWEMVDKTWRFPPQVDSGTIIVYGPCDQTYTLKGLRNRTENPPPRWSSFSNTRCNSSLRGVSFDGLVFVASTVTLAFLTRRLWILMLSWILRATFWCIKLSFRIFSWIVWKIYRFFTWPVRNLCRICGKNECARRLAARKLSEAKRCVPEPFHLHFLINLLVPLLSVMRLKREFTEKLIVNRHEEEVCLYA
jgi:DnaJ domain